MLAASIDGFLFFWQPAASYSFSIGSLFCCLMALLFVANKFFFLLIPFFVPGAKLNCDVWYTGSTATVAFGTVKAYWTDRRQPDWRSVKSRTGQLADSHFLITEDYTIFVH